MIFLLITVFICPAQKKNHFVNDKKKDQYIYYFDEANKNRLNENYELSIEQYLKAVNFNPESAVSYFYLASLYIVKKDYSSAELYAKKAVDIQPDNFWYSMNLADLYNFNDKIKEALKLYDKLLQKHDYKDLVYQQVFLMLSKTGDYEKLIHYYEQKEKNMGLEDFEYQELYGIFKKIDQFNNAELVLRKLISLHDDIPKFKILLAEHFAQTGNIAEAQEEFKSLLNSFPDNNDVNLSYARFCKKTNNKTEYYKSVKLLIISDLEFNSKVNLLISGQYPNFPDSQYSELLYLLYSKHSNQFLANTLLAEYLIETNEKIMAVHYIREALKINQQDFNLILVLFELLYDTEQFKELYKEAEYIKQMYPLRSKIFFYQGIAAYKMENYKTAIEILLQGIEFVIEDTILLNQFYFYIAESYHELNLNSSSDEYFEKILNSEQKFYLAYNKYAFYLASRNIKPEKAETLAKICYNYDSENPVFANTYALCLYKNKNYLEALIYSTKSINKLDKNFDYLELHGDILFALNNKEDALKYWILSQKSGNTAKRLLHKIDNINNLKLEEIE